MSATIEVSVAPAEGGLDSPWSVMLRVQPERGRSIERCLSSSGSERIEVDPGEVSIEAVYASGRVESRTLVLADGETQAVKLQMPRPPNEAMRWLSLAREARRPLGGGRADRELFPPEPGFDSPEPDAHARTKASVLMRKAEDRVTIAADQTFPEVRVLELRDRRGVDVFGDRGGSALALLALTVAARPGVTRLVALPGPLDADVHAALRPVEDDAFPDVQIVPTEPWLATIVGFLERRDQRALGVAREQFVEGAIDAMRGKLRNPIGAAFGLAVLLRLGELKTVAGWSANLWNWFPALPDGAALRAAVLLRAPQEGPAWHDELRRAALGAAAAGAPLLSDSLRHLRRALMALRDADERDAQVEAAARWCDRLVRVMDADAVFTTVTIGTKEVGTVWGERRTVE